jgi:type 1 glutamine amidotransferase
LRIQTKKGTSMLKQLAVAILAVIVACATGSGPQARGEEKKADGKIRVVIIDGQNNHDWRSTTPHLKKVLENNPRFTADVSSYLKPGDKPGSVPTVPFPPDLDRYDVLLSNYNGAPWPTDFQNALEERLKSGKIALVIVHAANNAFGGWKDYNLMIGMGWRGNNFGDRLTIGPDGKELRVPKGKGPGAGHGARHPFRITIRDAEHPITAGMPREWMHAADELYHGMRGPIENVRLLATAFDDKSKGGTGEHEPMIWTVTYGKGRVFHTPMGHDLEAMRCIGFITALLRGTEWAATGEVTIGIPNAFPTADQPSSVASK